MDGNKQVQHVYNKSLKVNIEQHGLKFHYIITLANSTSHSEHVTLFFFFHSTQKFNVICLILVVRWIHGCQNPRDGGAWWAAVNGVAQSRIRLKRLSSSSSTYQTLNNCCLGYLSEEEVTTQEMTSGCISLPCISLAFEMLVGEWSVNAKFRILLSEKVKVKTDFLEKISLTPPVLEGEINAGFLKDYVFFSVFPDPVPMFGTLCFKCTC